jgi:hypothetical protein
MRDLNVLTCGLILNLDGVVLIIFFGLPLRPYVVVGRQMGFRLNFVGSERKVPIKVPINYFNGTD